MTSFLTLREALDLQDGGLLAFVGAGGKTSLIARLAGEIFDAGFRVAVTTTTKLAHDDMRDSWSSYLLEDGGEDAASDIVVRELACGKVPFFYSGTAPKEKLMGIRVEAAERLFLKVDFLLVEADGARRASFKIPRTHEPVIPPSATHILIVLGREAFELPATGEIVFNIEDMKMLGEAVEGEVLSPQKIASLLLRGDGYLRCVSPGRKAFIVINKIDTAGQALAAVPLAGELFHPSLEGVILASSLPGTPIVRADNGRDRMACVVLAAGKSERFGGQKLCEEVGGEPLVTRAVRVALEAGFERVCVVLGHEAGRVMECLDVLASHDDVMAIENLRYEDGVGTSIRDGVSAVSQWADAVMIMLADMPGIDAPLVEKIVRAYKRSNAGICHPVVGERRCHPVIFRKEFFVDLQRLGGEEGARRVIEGNLRWVLPVRIEGEGTQLDVDTPADLEKARSIVKK